MMKIDEKTENIYYSIVENIYYSIVCELADSDTKRTITFANSVSQLAFDRHGLNPTATLPEQNALCNALDRFFN